MKSVLIAVGAAVIGGLLALVMLSARNAYARRKKARPSRGAHKKRRKFETTKVVIWVCLVMGFAQVWCSYILAWFDHPQIAESLSQAAVTEIIGVVLAYCLKSTVENLSKNNRWPDKGAPPEGDAPSSDASENDEGGVG